MYRCKGLIDVMLYNRIKVIELKLKAVFIDLTFSVFCLPVSSRLARLMVPNLCDSLNHPVFDDLLAFYLALVTHQTFPFLFFLWNIFGIFKEREIRVSKLSCQ
jgi:hypothetical protein